MKFLEHIDVNPKISLQKGKLYPFIEMANVGINSREPISVERKAFTSGTKFQDGDSVFARIEPSLQNGKGFYCKDIGVGFGSTEFLVFRSKDSVIDSKFLYYFLKTNYIQKSMIGSMTGATGRQRVNNDIFKELDITIPDIDAQQKIADILFAYDDLIENNQKQIKLLEEAAQRLYKEWFIDLRFPGCEESFIAEGVPNGWERKTVEKCLSFYIGGGWGKDTPTGKNTLSARVIRGTDINDIKLGNFTSIPLRYHTENDLINRKLEAGDIIFELSNGNINNIGRTLLVDERLLSIIGESVICASFCKLLRPLDLVHSIILYCNIQYLQTSGKLLPYKKHGSNGINNFDFDGFLHHTILVPKNENLVKPIIELMDKIWNAQSQFAKLLEARDRLLPKLMSGELEI